MNIQDPKKKNVIKIMGGLVLVGLVAAGFYVVHNLNRVTTDDAYIEGRIHSVAPKISGTVLKVNVEDNQAVKRGDLLVEIDAVDYSLKENEAAANLEVRKATFEQAGRDRDRAESLYNGKVIPKERYEAAVTAYNLAKGQLDAAEQQFKISQQNLQYTKIYSPTDGYVTKKSVEAGNQIAAGQPLMAVIPLDDIWIIANYKETQLEKVKKGQRVFIKIDTYPDKTFTGKVDSIMAGTGA
ncbi:MAG: HlyD family secretion protein, partial [Candidatus Omnitrophica bacterium]|nr:HlyD family secretion protein [Candidatus Omnitrophota bacterium]